MYNFLIIIDLEYWKCPSRRLYVAKRDEYEVLRAQKAKNRLSLSRKRKIQIDDEEEERYSCIESNIQTVINYNIL